jgi:phosphopantothenoylcysteine decarboxylase/phosphopantothenate--cysteine ligase
MDASALAGKKILLGISGSIAAYKAAFLTRLLVKLGAEVKVLMTPAASKFITPLSLSTLSKNPVFTDVVGEHDWNNHVELGLWADAMLVAPATANTIARMANGICDNIITACYLSARCPVFVAPAMDLDMWAHPSTQQNVARLEAWGNHIIPVEDGELASGLSGKGRLAEPENIVAYLANFFEGKPLQLKGKKVLITSGPTYEPIDPVRFIGNRSTGKMGTAIADTLAIMGAEVTLVTGPTHIKASQQRVQTVAVETAAEMYEACVQNFNSADIVILSAAVADYTPKHVASEKIKKNDDEFSIPLIKTVDIAKSLGALKRPGQIMVGFALETNNELEHALGKLEKKNLDLIVLNSLQDKGAGFGHDTNKVTIIDRQKNIKAYELRSKTQVAQDIADAILGLM